MGIRLPVLPVLCVAIALLHRLQIATSFLASNVQKYNSLQVVESTRVNRNIIRGHLIIRKETSSNFEYTAKSDCTDENHAKLFGHNNNDDDNVSSIDEITDDDDDDSSKNYENECDDDDINARSMFGTKAYWNDVYIGRGDFPADTYSWYANWNELQQYIKPFVPAIKVVSQKRAMTSPTSTTEQAGSQRILIPGIGNDSLLIDMICAGYNQHHTLIVQDYSHYAMERQIELLHSIGCYNYKYFLKGIYDDDSRIGSNRTNTAPSTNTKQIDLYCCDITKKLPSTWCQSFDVIIEKGLLDAVYLSDDTNQNIQYATYNLHRTLKTNGILISISSVIPNELRRVCFPSSDRDKNERCHYNNVNSTGSQANWEWIRDGSTDVAKAGCFVLRKLQ